MENKVIEEYFATSEAKSVKVLIWLLNNRNENNIINGTLDMVALDCGVTKVTVNTVFQKLYKTGFLEKVRNSEYRLLKV